MAKTMRMPTSYSVLLAMLTVTAFPPLLVAQERYSAAPRSVYATKPSLRGPSNMSRLLAEQGGAPPTAPRNVSPGSYRDRSYSSRRGGYGGGGGGYGGFPGTTGSGSAGIRGLQRSAPTGRTMLYGSRTPGVARGYGLNVPLRGARNPIGSLYSQDIYGRPLGLPGPSTEDPAMRNFRTWVNPNVVLSAAPAETDAAAEAGLLPEEAASDPRSNVTFNTLIEDYIAGRREAYLDEGWRYFKDRDYRVAMDKFELADAVSVEDTAARSEVKNALLIGALASRQYATAIHSLGWLLGQDPRTGQIRDAGFLKKLPSLRDVYAADTAGNLPDYERHLQEVEQFATRNPEMKEAQIMRALMLWLDDSTSLSDPRRSQALQYARQLDKPDTEPMWRALRHLMEYALEESRREAPASPLPALTPPAVSNAPRSPAAGVAPEESR